MSDKLTLRQTAGRALRLVGRAGLAFFCVVWTLIWALNVKKFGFIAGAFVPLLVPAAITTVFFGAFIAVGASLIKPRSKGTR